MRINEYKDNMMIFMIKSKNWVYLKRIFNKNMINCNNNMIRHDYLY